MDEAKLIEFLQKIEALKSTLRHNWTKTGRQESAAEHTWRAALFFIIAHELFDLKVDPVKTLTMLLVHDIPEIAHGDIPAFVKDTDAQQHADHKAREAQEAGKIFGSLPDSLAKKYTDLFEEFEEGKTPEAKIAKVIERIESQLQHLDSGPEYWSKEEKGEHMLHYPDEALKNADDPHITKIWEIIHKELQKLSG